MFYTPALFTFMDTHNVYYCICLLCVCLYHLYCLYQMFRMQLQAYLVTFGSYCFFAAAVLLPVFTAYSLRALNFYIIILTPQPPTSNYKTGIKSPPCKWYSIVICRAC